MVAAARCHVTRSSAVPKCDPQTAAQARLLPRRGRHEPRALPVLGGSSAPTQQFFLAPTQQFFLLRRRRPA